MKIQTMLLCTGLLLPALGGCDTGSPDAGAVSTAAEAGSAGAGVAVATDASARSGGEERVFAREEVKGEGCPLLGSSDVAEVAEVAAAAVSANQVMDCVYEWETGYVIVHSIRAHPTVRRGRDFYARATRNMTAEQTQDSVQALEKTMDEKAAAGEISKDQAAIVGAMTGVIGNQALKNIALDGIGDQASHEGTRIMVLVGNVTFSLSARDGNRDFDLALSQALAQRVVRNLEAL